MGAGVQGGHQPHHYASAAPQQPMANPGAASQMQAAVEGQSAEASTTFALDTQHEDNINDCQFDYYGTQIASCDSKGFLQIRSVRNDFSQQ